MAKSTKTQQAAPKVSEKLLTTYAHRVAALEKHVVKFPNDAIASSSLQKLKAAAATSVNRRGGYKKKTGYGIVKVERKLAILTAQVARMQKGIEKQKLVQKNSPKLVAKKAKKA